MLFSYMQRVQLLLGDVRQVTFNPQDLISYINTARGQIAGDAECVRRLGSLALTQGTQPYAFSAVTGLGTDVKGPINVRNTWYGIGSGFTYVSPKSYEWYSVYYLDSPLAVQGPPDVWAQFGQGNSGTIYFGPTPDTAYTVQTDTVCTPVDLANDTTPEAIPVFWTDAVPFLAAWYALMNAQSMGSQADPDKMFGRYEAFRDRARKFANPSVLTGIYPQSADPAMANRLGMAKAG